MKKKLIEALKWIGFIVTVSVVSFINGILIRDELFRVYCILIGDVVICAMVIGTCLDIYRGIIKFTKKRWRKSENGI